MLNILLVGDPKVGKSTIVRHFRGAGDSTIVRGVMNGELSAEERHSSKSSMVEVEFPNGAVKKVIFTELQTRDVPSSDNPANDTSDHNSAPGLERGQSTNAPNPQAPPVPVADLKYDIVCICYEEPTYLKKIMEEKHAFFAHPVPKIALKCRQDARPVEIVPVDALRSFEEFGLVMFSECSIQSRDFSAFTNDLLRVLENP